MTSRAGQFVARLRVFLEGAHRHGFLRTVAARVVFEALSAATWVVFLPVTLVLHAVGYRRLTAITSRIGHIAIELDCFVKERALGWLPARKWFVTAPAHTIANNHYLEYWAHQVPILTNHYLCIFLQAMSKWYFMKHDVSAYTLRLSGSHTMYPINSAWATRDPVIRLRDEDANYGRSVLGRLGVPSDAWFVCFHVREPGFSSSDDSAHIHRNASLQMVVSALEEITRRGGWCIRMGDPSGSRMPSMVKVIDYAHSFARSERMDVFLCASARFFLGNTSGISFVSSSFGVPVAFANVIPVATLGMRPGDLSIPKLLRRRGDAKLMSFNEIFGSPIANFRFATLYDNAGVEVIENSPDEILDLAREMLDRLEGAHIETNEDRVLQARYMNLLGPGDIGYQAASRVGAAFLRKHRELLDV